MVMLLRGMLLPGREGQEDSGWLVGLWLLVKLKADTRRHKLSSGCEGVGHLRFAAPNAARVVCCVPSACLVMCVCVGCRIM